MGECQLMTLRKVFWIIIIIKKEKQIGERELCIRRKRMNERECEKRRKEREKLSKGNRRKQRKKLAKKKKENNIDYERN